MASPERAILAALDTILELAVSALRAEHVALAPDGHLSREPDYEPYIYDALPIAAALSVAALRLRGLIAEYRNHLADSATPGR